MIARKSDSFVLQTRKRKRRERTTRRSLGCVFSNKTRGPAPGNCIVQWKERKGKESEELRLVKNESVEKEQTERTKNVEIIPAIDFNVCVFDKVGSGEVARDR